MLVDAHCHIDGFTPEELKGILARAKAKGIRGVVANGITLNHSKTTVAIGQAYDGIWTAVGIHPWRIQPVDDNTYRELKALAGQPTVAFIGEIGLDLNRDPSTIGVQKQALERQIRLALEVKLPLNIHCSMAHKELIEILKAVGLPHPPGLIHGFSGDLDTMKTYVDMGFCISLGRSLLQPDAGLEEAVRWLPLNKLLLETDFTVRSWKEQGFEPALVAGIADKVAAIKKATPQAVKRAASRNFRRLVK